MRDRAGQLWTVALIAAIVAMLLWATDALGGEEFQVGEIYPLRGVVCDTPGQVEEVMRSSDKAETFLRINQRDGENSCVFGGTYYRYEGKVKTFYQGNEVLTIHRFVPVLLYPRPPQPVWYGVTAEKLGYM